MKTLLKSPFSFILWILYSTCLINVHCLNVLSMIDGIEIPVNTFIEIQNLNQATLINSDNSALQQSLTVDITDMYRNNVFDVFIFERTEEGQDSQDFLCYKKVVETQIWTKECDFLRNSSLTTMLLNQQSYQIDIKSKSESNDLDKHIVIDNTPYPPQGNKPRSSFNLLVQTRTEFQNPVNMKTIVIIESMVCLIILFACGLFLYLYLKVKQSGSKVQRYRKDIKEGQSRRQSLYAVAGEEENDEVSPEKLD